MVVASSTEPGKRRTRSKEPRRKRKGKLLIKASDMMLGSLIEPESKGEMTKETQEEKNKKQKEKKTTDQSFSHDAGS
jgi:hypothetical protein